MNKITASVVEKTTMLENINPAEDMNSIIVILNKMKQDYKYTKERERQLTLLLTDINHEIELEKMDAIQMTRKFKELQLVLKLRRETKDKLQLFNNGSDISKIDDMIKNGTKMQTHMSKITNQSKVYTYRIKEEIRKELLTVE